jgi:integrase
LPDLSRCRAAISHPRPAPDQIERILAAVASGDRALSATAFYAGLRRGELYALRPKDVDLAGGVIHVRHGWDRVEGEIDPKSARSRRVPIPAALRDYLVDRRLEAVMIAAGVNAKALSESMRHATISITFDLYGHLLPGSRDEAAGLLDAFLARSAGADTSASPAQNAAHPAESQA